MHKKRNIIIVVVVLLVLLVSLGIVFIQKMGAPVASVDVNSVPKFITANYVDVSLIDSISKFRSAEGHDYSDSTTPCSSMKHYFSFPRDNSNSQINEQNIPPAPTAANGVPIFSPVDGTIVSIQSENFPLGKQIQIRVKAAGAFTVILFHIYPLDNVREGMEVSSGTQIGLINKGQTSDIAIRANALSGRKLFSVFEFMNDATFAKYKALGVTSRDQFIITEEYRAAHPLKCNGEQFVNQNQNGTNNDDRVVL